MIQVHHIVFGRAIQAIGSRLYSARFSGCLIVAVWLAFVQPGMSYYWLIDSEFMPRSMPEIYGQLPDGETLPVTGKIPPREHPISPGLCVSGITLTNPFDAVFYRVLLSPSQRLALLGQRVEAGGSLNQLLLSRLTNLHALPCNVLLSLSVASMLVLY